MTVKEFENAVWETEKIRIVIRAPENSQLEVKEGYYDNAANQTWRLSELIEKRIKYYVGDNREVIFIRGNGTPAPLNLQVGTLRGSYDQG